MTKTHQNRIIEAIGDCLRFIEKEESRNPALRPAETQKLLDWYKAHHEKLVSMLEAA